MRAEIFPRPGVDDDRATEQTIHHMRRYALEDAGKPEIERAVQHAYRLAGCRADSSDFTRAHAIWMWIRTHVRFREDREIAAEAGLPDPDQAEVLIRPADLVRMNRPAGDCDDFSMLAAAMLIAAGIPVSFLTLATNRGDDRWSHVCCVAHTWGDYGDVTVDASHGTSFGWRAESHRAKEWPVIGGVAPLGNVAGLGSIDWGSIIVAGVKAGSDIARARFAVPPSGTYIQTPGGTVFRQPDGSSAFAFPGVAVGPSSSTLLIVAAVVVLLVVTKR